MRCIELKICLVLHQNPTSNFGTTHFFFFPYKKTTTHSFFLLPLWAVFYAKNFYTQNLFVQ
jgi:hypothetical protein